MLWLHITVEFLIGCGLLAWSADRFVTSCISIARHFSMPALLIGMLLVGFGTSFPELVVSAIASFKNNAGIAIGNAIGSNVANIGLVIGITALIAPLSIHSQLLKREFPILIAITLVIGVLFFGHVLSRTDGFILLALLAAHLFWMIRVAYGSKLANDAMTKEYEKEMRPEMSLKKAWIWWFVGLLFLFVASELLVDSASMIARWMHVSELVIGLTIVAIGTSLPELAATVVSARRGEHDIAIGNVVGSNIFNLLAVLAMPALFRPGPLPSHLFTRDYPIMLAFTLALWLFSAFPVKKLTINRIEGAILLLGFFGYITYLMIVSI